jgi:hypothetical protein
MSQAVVSGALVVCALMGSCNYLAPAAYLAFGQPKAPALYEPLDRSTVVFVDDRNNAIPMNATRIRREIADQVSTALMEQEVITDMISFQGSPDGYSPRPTASCQLKIIDVANRARLFPAPGGDQPFFPVTVISPPISPELYTSTDGRRQIETILAVLLGDQIGKLFYKHVPDELGTRLDPQ